MPCYSPGPGAYDPHSARDAIKQRTASYSIGERRKPSYLSSAAATSGSPRAGGVKSTPVKSTPGPGSYDVASVASAKSPRSSPAYTIGLRQSPSYLKRETECAAERGPGRYAAHACTSAPLRCSLLRVSSRF